MGKLMVGLARILPLWALLSIFLSGIAAQSAQAKLGPISIRSVYTTDDTFDNKIVFKSSDRINYHVDVDNTTGSTFPIDVRLKVVANDYSPNPNLYHYETTYHIDQMPVGLSRFYTPVTLPDNAASYFYALQITITPSGCFGTSCENDGDNGENTFTIQQCMAGLWSCAPAGKAPNLIVLVHGANTGPNDVGVLGKVADEIENWLKAKGIDDQWEIVVWDWHEYTPTLGFTLQEGFHWNAGDIAYENAIRQGDVLADAIKLPHPATLGPAAGGQKPPYKYVHLIGHSAGAKLIQEAATAYISDYFVRQQNPFIHLTFLDPYTPSDGDVSGPTSYGFLPANYPNHFSEQYANRGDLPEDLPLTNSCLSNGFNFDITNWVPKDDSPAVAFGGHQWPHRWYKLSVTSADAWIKSGFKYGFPLSLEGSNNDINGLTASYPPGEQCPLFNPETHISNLCIPTSCW